LPRRQPAAANQDLTRRRAAAASAYLVAKHGIDSSRLNSAGYGDKKPAAPNTTPEGRQQNRRVELVKM
jgi:OmpA-OmpF porin, OOP family